jgi:hypothetical protein
MKERNFSLILGGPSFQLLRKAGLTGDVLELVRKRIIIISLVAWLPLLILAIAEGQAWGTSLTVPFVKDFDMHIRFLVAMPLLIIAELVVHTRMLTTVSQFQERKLVPDSFNAQFDEAIASALRWRNSILAEVLIVIIIYVIGFKIVWGNTTAVGASAWYLEPKGVDGQPSLAGIWFRYLSLPIFQFLFLRWYYRIFIWARFLFQVSKIKLHLVPTHPDAAGGLGFLNNTAHMFIPLALAHGALLAGMISNNIFFQGAKLFDFKTEVIAMVSLVLCLVLVPLFSFIRQLSDARRKGSLQYGKLASQFVLVFERKWLSGQDHHEISTMGGDIQSLSDLSNSFNVVQSMKILPINRNSIFVLIAVTVAPVVPLLLTMMPLAELIKMLAGIIL